MPASREAPAGAQTAQLAHAGRGQTGHLELVCSLDARGESHLSRQSFRAPFHISKPHRDAGALVVNLASTSPGLLAGDFLALRAAVEPGARLLLTTPGATRAHRMTHGGAELRQDFAVGSGASLEVWPELFIPHKGSRYRQRTTVRVEKGGEALIFELVAPGRVASGEVFAFEELRWTTDVFVGGQLIARERYRFAPGDAAVVSLQSFLPAAYYGSCYALSPALGEGSFLPVLDTLQADDAWLGCSRLSAGGVVIKVVASGSVPLRRTLHEVRRALHAALGRPAPALRRTQPIG